MQRLKTHDNPSVLTLDPAVAVEYGIKEINAVALLGIVLSQPVDEGTAYVPHRGSDEVKEVLAFVADLFERAVVLKLADVDPLRELFFIFP